MTELDRALIRRKLCRILRNLEDLQEVEDMEVEAFRGDRFRRKGTEKLLQEVVEAAVDINLHVVRVRGEPVPTDYFGSFLAVGRAGILTIELAESLAPSTGLRNRLVHEYDDIDDAIVLDAVARARRLYPKYAAEISRWIDEDEGTD